MRIITMNKWNIGDYAIARIAKKTYANVQITKCEDGTFCGDKVIGIEQIGDESQVVEKLCYFVQISGTGDRLWIPATELQLAESAIPFYGEEKQVAGVSTPSPTKKSESADTPAPMYTEDEHSGAALPWCLVCGESEELKKCIRCPASYHRHCTKQWFNNMMHRQNLPRSVFDRMFALKKQFSSTPSIKVVQNEMVASDLCPSCRWGPSVGYGDIVWQKMKSCLWWPARILSPESLPSCLASNREQSDEWPVLYYGTEKYSWCSRHSVVLFLPKQADTLVAEDEEARSRRAAVMDACDDYVSAYLV